MKLLTQTLVLATAMAIGASALAQSPPSATRQRKTTPDGPPGATPTVKASGDQTTPADAASDQDKAKLSAAAPADSGPFSEPTPVATPAAAAGQDGNKSKPGDKSSPKSQSKPLADVTADGQTNRADPSSEEAAIVPYYNNFFTTYRLGPEDIISVNVFGQERYSKSGITIGPSGRISLALIPDGIFVNGKTVDQVAELIKKRYDEYIIDPQVSVSLDRAGSYRYSVIGDVAQPGIKLMSRRLSVTEALSEAGGVLQTGNRNKVFVLRRQANGTLTPIPVNVSAIYRGQAPDSVYLVPGDQVVVPGNTLKKLQTIMGFTQVLSFARLFTGGF
jgi:polysaccharide export outer membrane protein